MVQCCTKIIIRRLVGKKHICVTLTGQDKHNMYVVHTYKEDLHGKPDILVSNV